MGAAETVDAISLLSSPIGAIFAIVAAAGFALFLVMPRDKGEFVWAAERLKPGEWAYDFRAKLMRKKKGEEPVLKLKDGREFVIPEEKLSKFERVLNRKTGRFGKMFPLENGQVVEWSEELSEQPNPMLDHKTVSQAMNRGSLRKLAGTAFGGANAWVMVLLAAGCAFAIGYILYPEFNHPAGVVEICTQLANGTLVPRGVCP